VFYWYRLWVVIDKNLREELDNAQSVVDSTVYISFSLYLSGVIMFAYAGIDAAMNMYRGWSWLSYVDNMQYYQDRCVTSPRCDGARSGASGSRGWILSLLTPET
jgi:hypothetical protein